MALAGDFNIDLLKTETMEDTKDFFDILTSNLFVPHITLPTRVKNRSQTLIDSIYSNNPDSANCTSDNFTFSIYLGFNCVKKYVRLWSIM